MRLEELKRLLDDMREGDRLQIRRDRLLSMPAWEFDLLVEHRRKVGVGFDFIIDADCYLFYREDKE